MKDVFLSYKRDDRKLALWLKHELESEGIFVWMDVEEFDETPPQMRYHLCEGLTDCQGLVVLVTPRYAASKWCEFELWASSRLLMQVADRFPALRKSVMLATAAAQPVVLSEDCTRFIDVGPPSALEDIRPDLTSDMHRLRVASLCNTSWKTGGVIETENTIFFPIYTDDFKTSALYLRHAVRKWKQSKLMWVDAFGTNIPELGGDRAKNMKQIWEWIPALKRYDKKHINTVMQYIDVFRQGKHRHLYPISQASPALLRAVRHLLENRNFSMVLNEDMMLGMGFDFSTSFSEVMEGRQESESYIGIGPFAHVGNPTDVVIGITSSKEAYITQLEGIYRHLRSQNSQINDLFDLSILAAFIVSLDKWSFCLTEFEDVEEEILKPLVKPLVNEPIAD